MLTDDFDYELPEELIAQAPMEPRDACRLMVLGRKDGSIENRIFSDIVEYLRPGDLLVLNETRVLPARLIGRKANSGGVAEILLLKQIRPDFGDGSAEWEGLVRPGKRLKPGAVVEFYAADKDEAAAGKDEPRDNDNSVNNCGLVGNDDAVSNDDAAGKGEPTGNDNSASLPTPVMIAEIADWLDSGARGARKIIIKSTNKNTLDEAIHLIGRAPLPPYIHAYRGDPELYQTVYSKRESSAAAPTAGLHFTEKLLNNLRQMGVNIATVELEIGMDTFRAVTSKHAEDHQMHSEVFYVSQETIDAIERTHRSGNRVIAVGTTTMRSLESAWDPDTGKLTARNGESTSLFILPGYEFHAADALISNFHVPRSTLMMLVSAFAGRENILNAYAEAVKLRYRMLSFGDAMLIL